jgi:ABC-type phosphate transport system permease subunit
MWAASLFLFLIVLLLNFTNKYFSKFKNNS